MLNGLRIIEYASYIAAPAAGGMLADWGADVVKIEPLDGDPIRGFFSSIGADTSANPVFELDNRGKRSLALDTATRDGADIARRLAAAADIFITNTRPDALARAGLDYQTLNAVNPRLVYGIITGYGLDGPQAHKPAMDVTAFWSHSGLGRLTVPKDAEIYPSRTGMGDHMTGVSLVAGIMAALYELQRSGRGRLVETSLLRNGVYAIASDMAIQLRLGRIASTRPRAQAVNPIGNFFKAACGNWLCVMPRQGNQDWSLLCAALGLRTLAADRRFATTKARRDNRVELVAVLDETFAAHSLEHWTRILDEADLVWAPVQTPAQVASDAQAEAAGAFVDISDDAGGTYRAPATPVAFPKEATAALRPAPGLGAHSREILSGAGYPAAEIEAFIVSGVVAEPA
jgi:crotonobetainyl-CoA:carnitine CoA-transferase CaiB-like acyl-CoA transferase